MEDDYVKVASAEGADFMEFPVEEDGNLLLSTVQSHFPNAIGLKFKASSGAMRGLRASDNIFAAPRGGWGDSVYYVTESEATKRKIDDVNGTTKRKAVSSLLQDIAVLGLPWSTTEDELKEYFETFGELSYYEVKKERDTGKSRGFGFVRFKTEEGAQAAVNEEHYLNGRKVDLRYKKDTPMKLFVGRIPSGTTKEDLWDYFVQFGELKDTYIPQPFKGFGFITFSSSEVGNLVLSESHVLNGMRLNVDKGEDSKSFNMKRGMGGAGNMPQDNYQNNFRNMNHNMNQNMNPNPNMNQSTPSQTNFNTPDYRKQESNPNPDQELKTMLLAYLAKQVQ